MNDPKQAAKILEQMQAIDRLQAELDAAKAEIQERVKDQDWPYSFLAPECRTLRRAIAEAKADNERLREALSSIPCCGECYPGHECSIREIKEQALTGDTHD